jgi:hypothetical protein
MLRFVDRYVLEHCRAAQGLPSILRQYSLIRRPVAWLPIGRWAGSCSTPNCSIPGLEREIEESIAQGGEIDGSCTINAHK